MPIPIEVVGTDPLGSSFVEQAVTIAVGREGARIALQHSLTSDQEITVRNLSSGTETDMRVLGQVQATPEGYHYAVELLDPAVDIWGLPSASESQNANIWLACVRCQGRSEIQLHPFAMEVLDALGTINEPCSTCRDRTFWKRAPAEAPTAADKAGAQESASTPRAPDQEKRRSKRLPLRLNACIRTREHGDDLVPTSNVSTGGFGFQSGRHYALGTTVEVCAPYAPGAVNIFSPARIASIRPLPNETGFNYGVAYLQLR